MTSRAARLKNCNEQKKNKNIQIQSPPSNLNPKRTVLVILNLAAVSMTRNFRSRSLTNANVKLLSLKQKNIKYQGIKSAQHLKSVLYVSENSPLKKNLTITLA